MKASRSFLSDASQLAAYVHVPFCVVKCGYCDFHSLVPSDSGPIDAFLDALERELTLVPMPAPPRTAFVGGGTPTFLDAARFERLLRMLVARLRFPDCEEVTIEANPESVTADKLRLARAHGIDRVSIGAQSFDAARLRFLDRPHDATAIRRAVDAARAAGFTNLSLDLIFGLPGQSWPDWRDDLEQALALAPDHLSCYCLTYEPGTRLHAELRRGRITPNDDAVDLELFLRTRARLADAGFTAYEISNFAGRGGPCRHNDHYWLQGDYAGFGPGASSHRQGVRWTNLKPIDAYASALARGTPPVATAETLGRTQRAAEAIWLGLRRRDGVDFAAVEQRLGVPVRAWFAPVVAALLAEGLVEWHGTQLRLTEAGLPQADRAGAAFLHLDATAAAG